MASSQILYRCPTCGTKFWRRTTDAVPHCYGTDEKRHPIAKCSVVAK